MKKNIIIAFLLTICLVQTVLSRSVNNPAIMHIRLREFVAAGALQGILAARYAVFPTISYDQAAQQSVRYADALLEELDK